MAVNEYLTSGWNGAKNRGSRWFRRNASSIAVVLVIFGLWEFYSRFLNTRGDIYFPSIEFAVRQSVNQHAELVEGMRITFTEVMAGFALSIVFGITLGVLFSEFFIIRQSSFPLLIFAYSLPNAILAPIFVIWFGTGLLSIALYVSWLGFFPIMISTITGMSQVDEEFHQLGEVAGATHWQMITKIKIWAALPNIKAGLKIGVQQSIVGAIVGEFVATGGGLGYIILAAHRLLEEGLMMGALFTVMVFAGVLYKAVGLLIDYLTPP